MIDLLRGALATAAAELAAVGAAAELTAAAPVAAAAAPVAAAPAGVELVAAAPVASVPVGAEMVAEGSAVAAKVMGTAVVQLVALFVPGNMIAASPVDALLATLMRCTPPSQRRRPHQPVVTVVSRAANVSSRVAIAAPKMSQPKASRVWVAVRAASAQVMA